MTNTVTVDELRKFAKSFVVEALSEEGFERRLCWDRLNENRRVLDYLDDLPESTDVCGKCVALMPCSFKNPVAVYE